MVLWLYPPVPSRVDRDAAVPASQNGSHCLLVETGISWQHEHFVQWCHGPAQHNMAQHGTAHSLSAATNCIMQNKVRHVNTAPDAWWRLHLWMPTPPTDPWRHSCTLSSATLQSYHEHRPHAYLRAVLLVRSSAPHMTLISSSVRLPPRPSSAP